MWVGGVRVVIPNETEDKVLMVCQHHEGRDIWMNIPPLCSTAHQTQVPPASLLPASQLLCA